MSTASTTQHLEHKQYSEHYNRSRKLLKSLTKLEFNVPYSASQYNETQKITKTCPYEMMDLETHCTRVNI